MKFKIWLENNITAYPYIFLDLDETLVKTVKVSDVEEAKQRIKELQSDTRPLAATILKNREKEIATYKRGIPFRIIDEERIIIPRPHLKECLQQLSSLGILCILTAAMPLYATTIIKTLHFDEMFNGRIYGMRTVPQISADSSWVLVDDLESSFGHKADALGANLDQLEQLKMQHYIPIMPFHGEENDNELSSLPTKIRARLFG